MSTILHHTCSGPEDAPTLVLLHGFLGRGSDWGSVIEHLGARYRTIAIDLPGHGKSLNLPDDAYTWEGAVAAIGTTIDHLGIGRFHMAGYSMGGRFAIGYVLQNPRRVIRLVLSGASPGLRSEADRMSRRILDDARADDLENDFPAFLRSWYAMPLFRPLIGRPELLKHLRDPEYADHPLSRLQNSPTELARAIRGFSPAEMPDYWRNLDDLGSATLAVAGSRDEAYVRLSQQMAAMGRPVMPQSIPNAGHLLLLEQPAALAHAFSEFLIEHPRKSSLHHPPLKP